MILIAFKGREYGGSNCWSRPEKTKGSKVYQTSVYPDSHHYHHGDLRQNHDFDYVDDYNLQRLNDNFDDDVCEDLEME